MSQATANGSAPPSIPSGLFWRYPDPGVEPPAVHITNGPAFGVIFTDKQGNPLKDDPHSPRCAIETIQRELPPCNLAVRLSMDKTQFVFVENIALAVKPGTYVFYVRAQALGGWSNTCTCTMQINPR